MLSYKLNYDGTGAEKIAEIPFDSEYKYRAALATVEGKRVIFTDCAIKAGALCAAALRAKERVSAARLAPAYLIKTQAEREYV